MPEVDDVLARVHFSGLDQQWPDATGRSSGEGVEPAKEAKLSTFMHIVTGRQLADSDRFGVLVGQGVAQALKLAPGDRVTLLLNTADGALNSLDLDVVGVFQSFSKEYDARAVRIPAGAAQELLGSQGVNTLVVSLKRTADTDRVAAQLVSAFGPAATGNQDVGRAQRLLREDRRTLRPAVRRPAAIILVMVLLSVANTVNMSVFERTGEFGTMRALGNRAGHVFRLILIESALLGLIGAALGVALGVALALADFGGGHPDAATARTQTLAIRRTSVLCRRSWRRHSPLALRRRQLRRYSRRESVAHGGRGCPAGKCLNVPRLPVAIGPTVRGTHRFDP